MKILYSLFVFIINKIKDFNKNIHVKNFIYKFKKCGNNIKFYGAGLPVIKGVQNITIGDNVFINEYAYLFARADAEIKLSNNVTISSFAKLITGGYDLHLFFEGAKTEKDIHINKSIFIGDNCWIGANSIILPGVEIKGKNVVIAAGSVVTKSFDESNVLIAGNPAIIKKHFVF